MSIDRMKKVLFCKQKNRFYIVKNGRCQEVNPKIRQAPQMRPLPEGALTVRETAFDSMIFYKWAEFRIM
jgi:hypothetical protein